MSFAIRDRIKELRRVPANQLHVNEKNWRTHSEDQLQALRGLIDQIGFAGVELTYERPDGSLVLIDGHARREIAGDQLVPVAVTDLTEAEADLLLATFDPIGAMAGADQQKLAALLDEVNVDGPLKAMLDELAGKAAAEEAKPVNIDLTPSFAVMIRVPDEDTQRKLMEQADEAGFENAAVVTGLAKTRTYETPAPPAEGVVRIVRETPIQRTARVRQIEGMFDLPASDTIRREWDYKLDLPEQWNLGLIVGPSGCIDGDTPIYDPVENETLSVRARFLLGKPFHVWSWDGGRYVIAKAMPPVEYPKAQLFEVKTSNGSTTVTGKHRFLSTSGEWLTASDVSKQLDAGVVVRLRSTLEPGPSIHRVDDRHSCHTTANSLVDCHLAPHCDDAQLPEKLETGPKYTRPQVDAREHIRCDSRSGATHNEREHNRPCQSSGLLSTMDSIRQTGKSDSAATEFQNAEATHGRDPGSNRRTQQSIAYSGRSHTTRQPENRVHRSTSFALPTILDLALAVDAVSTRLRRAAGSFLAAWRPATWTIRLGRAKSPATPGSSSTARAVEERSEHRQSGEQCSFRSDISGQHHCTAAPTSDRQQPLCDQRQKGEPCNNSSCLSCSTVVVSVVPKAQDVYYDFHVPRFENYWACGLIHHNSGKTSLAREWFGDRVIDRWDWPDGKAIVDGFPEGMPIQEVTGLLSSVGFSSPPGWTKPYHVLSNGEKFRVDVARTLAEMPDLAVIDEFTSVVDRTVAKIGSAAVAKAVRQSGRRLVAVSCHYDIAEWLCPDWMLDCETGTLTRRSLQRPPVALTVRRADTSAWRIFREHHYLSHDLHKGAACFVAKVDHRPAAFLAVIHSPHPTHARWRASRIVCLPDFQGIGLGSRLTDLIAAAYTATGKEFSVVTSHPAMIASLAKSPNWRAARSYTRPGMQEGLPSLNTEDLRLTCRFIFNGEPNPDHAQALGILKS